MNTFLDNLVNYKTIIFVLFELCICTLIVLVVVQIWKKLVEDYKTANNFESKVDLANLDYTNEDLSRRPYIIKRMIATDGIDPGPNGYLILDDAGREIYARSFTINTMSKDAQFNKTFSILFDFPSCTSSVFIEPVSNREMSKIFDKHIDTLEQEIILAEGNTNRLRKLRGQRNETARWATEVEQGDDKFFNVGFLFTLEAESLEKLNTLSDDFRNAALSKSIQVSSLYAIQAEAFESNMPLNRKVNIVSKHVKSDGIVMHIFNSKALSTVLNYTSNSFSHKDGAPIGRNLFTKKPFVFNIYDPSHDGFTMVIAGKTGSGKSAMCKILCERYHLLGYRFVAIDSQKRKDVSEGEYATMAELLGGVNYQISNHTNNILNPFDVRESVIFKKSDINSGYEKRTLELSEKIQLVKNDIRAMMGSTVVKDDTLNTYIDRVIIDCIEDTYRQFGIKNKEPDSLYVMGEIVVDGQLTSGLVPKKMPTITDFYKNLLIAFRDNKDEDLRSAYKHVIMGVKDYVKELYYSADTFTFFTREEYEQLEDNMFKKNVKSYYNEKLDHEEEVHEIHGVRPYFDGQSTVSVSVTCPFTNIDISQLTDEERKIAREIAINFVNEQFIKVNSESIDSADQLVAIFDEAHENFGFPYARETLANATRTARKLNVSIWYLTQTIEEFNRYNETKDILRQAAVKIVGKQDPQDLEYLMKALHLTYAQADLICNHIGCCDEDDDEYKNKHRGEMCVVDNNKVEFIKVDMIRSTERLSVETSSEEIKKLYKIAG